MVSPIKTIRSIVGKTLLGKIKRRLFPPAPAPMRPHIPRPLYPASSPALSKLLLVAVPPYFDQDSISGAGTFILTGFVRGWSKVCGPAKLVSVTDLIREIDLCDNPAVFLPQQFFSYLSYDDAKRLRTVDLFVMVHVHPRAYAEFECQARNLTDAERAENRAFMDCYPKVLFAEPRFVWNSVGKASWEWYRGWQEDGLRWETLFVAADDERYFPDPAPEKYGNIKMAYVGGYWAEKAQGFELYLRPWEDVLVPFGYSQWPYRQYAGKVDEASEREIYSTAGLIPLVTGPLGWAMAEITERYLKAPACRAFCIADHNSALRELFSKDEMLQAESPEHFHELVRDYLAGRVDSKLWADRAYRAVRERHLYSHRALQIKSALEASRSK